MGYVKSPCYQILPGIGLGPLRFGLSMLEVEGILGKAEDVEAFEDSDIHLMYPSKGIFLFFEAEDQGRLSGIEVDNVCHCTLLGEEVFCKGRRQLFELLDTKLPGAEPGARIVHLEADGGTRLSRRDLAMDFYFDEVGSLSEVNWSPLTDEEGPSGQEGP